MISIFITSLALAITAFVYSQLLTEPGQLLAWWGNFLDRFFQNDRRYVQGYGPHPVYKLLIGCTRCVSGQFALWFFLFQNWSFYRSGELMIIPYHIITISITIFFATLITKLYARLNQNP